MFVSSYFWVPFES